MVYSDAKRDAMSRLRLLIKAPAQEAVKSELGQDVHRLKLEDGVMKIVRRVWNEQSEHIQQQLLQDTAVTLDMLSLTSIPAAFVAALSEADDAAPDPPGDAAAAAPEEHAQHSGASEEPSESAVQTQALNALLAMCITGPTRTDREHAIKAYISANRPLLMMRVNSEYECADHKDRDTAIRSIGRVEFDKLGAGEQWALHDIHAKGSKQGSIRGDQGRFSRTADVAGQDAGAAGQDALPHAQHEDEASPAGFLYTVRRQSVDTRAGHFLAAKRRQLAFEQSGRQTTSQRKDAEIAAKRRQLASERSGRQTASQPTDAESAVAQSDSENDSNSSSSSSSFSSSGSSS